MDQDGSEQHFPFDQQFPHLLQRIFEHLPPKDLQSCRQVCQFWDLEASPLLSSRSLLEYNPELGHAAPEFLSKVRSAANLLISVVNINDENLKNLLKEHGRNVKSLEIDFESENFEVVQCGRNLQNLVELCPRLEEMTLLFGDSERKLSKDVQQELSVEMESEQNCFVKLFKNSFNCFYNFIYQNQNALAINNQEDEIGQLFPPQFEGLEVNGCPSLKRLTLYLDIFMPDWTLTPEYFTNIFDFAPNVEDLCIRLFLIYKDATDNSIEALRRRPEFTRKLKSLSFGKAFGSRYSGDSPTLTLGNFEALRNLHFDCLQKLDIEYVLPWIWISGNEILELFRFLEDVSHTLKHLRMGFLLCKLETDFPWMPKLEELVLSYGHVNANFFAKCPNLVKCVVEQMESFDNKIENTQAHGFQWFEEVGTPIFLQSLRDAKERGMVHGGLKQLEILNMSFAPSDVKSLECFPSLSILKIKLSPTIWGESDVTKFVEMFPRIQISQA